MVVALSGPPRLGTSPGCEARRRRARFDDLFLYVCPPASRPPFSQHTSFSSSAVPSPGPPSSRARNFWRKCPASTALRLVLRKNNLWSRTSRETSTERTTPRGPLETSTAPAARSTRVSRRPSRQKQHHRGNPCASFLSTGGMPNRTRTCGADSFRGAWWRFCRPVGGVSRAFSRVVASAGSARRWRSRAGVRCSGSDAAAAVRASAAFN